MEIDERAYQAALGKETNMFVRRLFRIVVESYEAAKAQQSIMPGEGQSVDRSTGEPTPAPGTPHHPNDVLHAYDETSNATSTLARKEVSDALSATGQPVDCGRLTVEIAQALADSRRQEFDHPQYGKMKVGPSPHGMMEYAEIAMRIVSPYLRSTKREAVTQEEHDCDGNELQGCESCPAKMPVEQMSLSEDGCWFCPGCVDAARRHYQEEKGSQESNE